jgi:N-acetylneuraminic acid mutarotase
MKQIHRSLFTLMLLAVLFSCTKASLNYAENGNWVGRATFSGIAMGAGASFVINNIAYVGTGINPLIPHSKLQTMFSYTATAILNKAYGYDSAYGSWAQVGSFPGQGRSDAVGFTIGSTGYLGSGLANDGATALSDFYSYNAAANTWTQIDSIHNDTASFPRYDAVAFAFDTTAYVLTGTNQLYYFNDIWRYSPSTNTWIQQPVPPSTFSPRSGAISWVYNSQGYIVTGYTPGSSTATGNLCYDFWRFTPGSDTSTQGWYRLRDIYNTSGESYDDSYTDIERTGGNGFLILGQPTGDKAYVTLGSANGVDVTFTWEYTFSTDLWNEKTPYEGTARTGACSWTLTGSVPSTAGVATTRGFIGTGLNQGSTAAFSDCEEFFPNQVYNQYD